MLRFQCSEAAVAKYGRTIQKAWGFQFYSISWVDPSCSNNITSQQSHKQPGNASKQDRHFRAIAADCLNLIFFQVMHQHQSEENEEQEFVQPPYPKLQLSFKDKTQYQCLTLYIATYGASSLFAHSLVGGEKIANRVNFSRAKQQSLADLYQVNESIVLIFNDHLEPMKEIHFSKFIAEHVSFKKAVLLSSVSRTTLKQPSNASLSYVSTSSAQKPSVPRFQQGIMGIEADILQYCQLNAIPTICYIGILGEYELSSEIIESVFGVLRGSLELSSSCDISAQVKRYNMKKYSNKIYL